MEPNKTKAQLLFEKVVTIEALPWEKEPTRPTDTENMVCRDDDRVPELERVAFKTPLAVLDNWAHEQTSMFGKSVPQISILKSCREWGGTAHLEIETPPMLTDDGLVLHFSVTCNPRYMAQPSDLIPIFLETPGTNPIKPGDPRLMVVVIEPTWDFNHWEIRVEYTLAQLAKILKVALPVKSAAQITEKYNELGLRAQWYGVYGQTLPAVNGVKHESGGVDQKGGSGKLRLLPYTEKELRDSEKQRNTSWNMSEKLNFNRPVFNRYESILQDGKEMMTTLECESEYKLYSEEAIDDVIRAMKLLHDDFELQKGLGIVKMTGEKKKYTDTYFDLPKPCDLLSHRIVLRRRHRSTDIAGTYLFALKGATHVDDRGRRLRLAAQVQLKNTALRTDALRHFLSVETVDNAISRTLSHALRQAKADDVIARLSTEDIIETLVIESVRETYTMSLANGTQIDFSADKATGTLATGGVSTTVYSFEFGVGHPALTQAATTGGALSKADDEDEKFVPVKDRMKQFGQQEKVQIIRPYHVPADLTNPEVFVREDYLQFVELRNRIVTEVLKLDLTGLELGGNKAHDLAWLLSLIK